MTRLLAALFALTATAALAQDGDDDTSATTEVQVPGMTVKMRVGAQPLGEPGPPPNQVPASARPSRLRCRWWASTPSTSASR